MYNPQFVLNTVHACTYFPSFLLFRSHVFIGASFKLLAYLSRPGNTSTQVSIAALCDNNTVMLTAQVHIMLGHFDIPKLPTGSPTGNYLAEVGSRADPEASPLTSNLVRR